jgi:hypothetical protein
VRRVLAEAMAQPSLPADDSIAVCRKPLKITRPARFSLPLRGAKTVAPGSGGWAARRLGLAEPNRSRRLMRRRPTEMILTLPIDEKVAKFAAYSAAPDLR